MKFQNLKNKAKYSLATVAVSAMSAPVMAEGILDTVKQEIRNHRIGRNRCRYFYCLCCDSYR